MNTQPSSGGTGLLAVVAIATIFIVTVECLFLALPSYWLLAAVLSTLILVAVGVAGAVVALIDHDGLELRPPRRVGPKQPAARPETAPAGRPVLGH
jgi:hypothetical protein